MTSLQLAAVGKEVDDFSTWTSSTAEHFHRHLYTSSFPGQGASVQVSVLLFNLYLNDDSFLLESGLMFNCICIPNTQMFSSLNKIPSLPILWLY